jgi:hypothetical protein
VRLFFALSLLAAAGATAAEEPKETKPAASQERPTLNLKLDNPGQYAREAPQETGGKAEPLPSLGADARPVPTTPTPTTTRPFPADSERPEPR